MTGFIGRQQDLAVLKREFEAQRASLIILYGRRRIGKSTLIQQASLDRPTVFFQATLVEDSLNLAAFKGEVSRVLGGDPILDGIPTGSVSCTTSPSGLSKAKDSFSPSTSSPTS